MSRGKLSRSHRSGDVIVATSPNEGILNEKQISNLGGKSGFYNLQSMLKNPINDDVLFPKVPTFLPVAKASNDDFVQKIGDEFKDAIKGIAITTSRLDNVGNVINDTVNKGVKRSVKYISKRPGFTRG